MQAVLNRLRNEALKQQVQHRIDMAFRQQHEALVLALPPPPQLIAELPFKSTSPDCLSQQAAVSQTPQLKAELSLKSTSFDSPSQQAAVSSRTPQHTQRHLEGDDAISGARADTLPPDLLLQGPATTANVFSDTRLPQSDILLPLADLKEPWSSDEVIIASSDKTSPATEPALTAAASEEAANLAGIAARSFAVCVALATPPVQPSHDASDCIQASLLDLKCSNPGAMIDACTEPEATRSNLTTSASANPFAPQVQNKYNRNRVGRNAFTQRYRKAGWGIEGPLSAIRDAVVEKITSK